MANADPKLVCTFNDAEGNSIVHVYPYVDSEVTASDVKTFINAVITNNSIYNPAPVIAVSAYIASATIRNIDISN